MSNFDFADIARRPTIRQDAHFATAEEPQMALNVAQMAFEARFRVYFSGMNNAAET
jgi:hypothetical protein